MHLLSTNHRRLTNAICPILVQLSYTAEVAKSMHLLSANHHWLTSAICPILMQLSYTSEVA
jgi:hypothetical protein